MKIGIDLTYSSINGVLTYNNQIINFIQQPLHRSRKESKKNIMNGIHSVISRLINPNVIGIGLSLPSKICSEKGVLYDLEQIPHWKGICVKRIIQEKYRVPVYISNDITCMVLGEKFYGKGRNFSNIICISLGEVTGTSCIINNNLNIYSKKTFENISCLSQSHYYPIKDYWKSYLRAIEELNYYLQKFPQEINNPEHEIWTNIGIIIGRLISILLNNYKPGIVILGGYLSSTFNTVRNVIKDYMKVFQPQYKDIHEIIVSCSNENIRSLGATLLMAELKKPNILFGSIRKSTSVSESFS